MNAPGVTATVSNPVRTLRRAATACTHVTTGLMRSGTTRRPPGRSWSNQARGMRSTLAVATTASTGAADGHPAAPSPTSTRAGDLADSSARRASTATSASSSTDVTAPPSPTTWARSAAL